MSILYIHYDDELVGYCEQKEDLTYSFHYAKEWLTKDSAFPVSLHMPLRDQTFGNRACLSFFENLLPEGDVRQNLPYGNDLFRFLDQYGADCAGAFTISHHKQPPTKSKDDHYQKIELDDIYEGLKNRKGLAEQIAKGDGGYLSIAGAQDKIAVTIIDNMLYLPRSGQPTTHIIKAPIQRDSIKDSIYNELFCLKLADKIGLQAVNCFILDGKVPLFVTKRYDRQQFGRQIKRVHQQDFCQAQGFTSLQKYENQGGPSFKDNYQLLINNVSIKFRKNDSFRLIDWLCYNLIIGNNDSHSKNISLISIERSFRLAPFYDILCTAIYHDLKRDFSFKIGTKYYLYHIARKDIRALEAQLGLRKDMISERLNRVATQIMNQKDELAAQLKHQYPQQTATDRISSFINRRIKALWMYDIINPALLSGKAYRTFNRTPNPEESSDSENKEAHLSKDKSRSNASLDSPSQKCRHPGCQKKLNFRKNSDPERIKAQLCAAHFAKNRPPT
jgi:serine/threonine-protein kinase HipA